MKIGIILGTRPEIIKMSPIIRRLERKGIDYFVLHTGQHYDFLMDKIFFKELELKPEILNLDVGSGTHAEVTGKILMGVEKVLMDQKPDIVLVQGDTNSVLAGALTCKKLHITLGHIEAGLRSYDRRMPEEYNRIICDHISDFLFAPTKRAEEVLRAEGIGDKELLYYDKLFTPKIILTGNTIVDAIQENVKKANEVSKILEKMNLKCGDYFLVTAHREENVDHKDRLLGILNGFKSLSDLYNLSIIYPMHPRTKKRILEFGLLKNLNEIKNLKVIDPVGFYDLLTLESNAKLVLTDSGGLQEETCSLRIPCVVLRDRSDRTESVEVGASMLAGCDTERIVKAVEIMLNKSRDWDNPFGSGNTSDIILDVLEKHYKK
jgi:UDP-N-acetylglucosamine 2-epimerase (non-hydrolysing)